jgi:hypothetical protein
LPASFKVGCRIAKYNKSHSVGEVLMLPAVLDIVDTVHDGESCAKELQKIPLADNTMGSRVSDISEDFCDQLISSR